MQGPKDGKRRDWVKGVDGLEERRYDRRSRRNRVLDCSGVKKKARK